MRNRTPIFPDRPDRQRLHASRRSASRAIGRGGSLAVLIAATLAATSPARAFDLFGIHLFGDKADASTSPDAQTYTIDIAVTGGDDALTNSVKGASKLWSDKDGKPPPSTPSFLSIAHAEYASIVGALRQNGYYGGSITITVAGRPLESYQPDAQLPHPVPVRIAVDAGPVFTFGRVDIAGRPPVLTDLRARTEVGSPEEVGLVSGKIARSDVILKAEQTLVESWRRQGHPKAKALPHVVVADFRTHTLTVSIGADPGPEAVFGQVHVNGTAKMDREYVARQTGITPGERWDQAKVDDANRRLRALQVFSSVAVKQDPTLNPDGSLDLTTTVADRLPHTYGFEGSYSTLDGLGVGGFWEHHNLFGHAEHLKLEANVSGIDSKTPAKYSYLAGATLLMPGYLGPDLDLITSVTGERQVLDPYTENTVQGQFGVIRHFTPTLTGSIKASAALVHASDAYGTRNLTLLSLPATLVYDGSDAKLEPSRGWRANLALEPFYETRFGHSGLITRATLTGYVPVDTARRYVFAGRLTVGSIVGSPADGLPPDRLFFAGGGQSVRGFAYRSLGPVLANGAVGGGLSLFETSLEFRAKVTDTIGVVPFVDAGSAYAASLPNFSERLRVGAGIGLRYYTGLGAIRVDVATPVNPRPGDSRFAIYLGLGESF